MKIWVWFIGLPTEAQLGEWHLATIKHIYQPANKTNYPRFYVRPERWSVRAPDGEKT